MRGPKIKRGPKKITITENPQYTYLEGAVHDIRGLVHSIYFKADCLLWYWQKLGDSERKSQLNDIVIAAKRLREFSDNFLDLSKIKAQKMPFEFNKVDLLKLINEVIAEYKVLDLHNNSLQLVLKATEFTKAIVYGDHAKLKQVLINLLNNANKHTKKGTLTIELQKVKDENNDVWHFSLADQGCGIAEGELQSIFEPYVQSTYNQKGGSGSGLGLAICKEIITAHQGKIWAENNSDSGATLHFMLPVLTPTNLNTSNLANEQATDTLVS